MTTKHFKNQPQCIYGNPCAMVCVNPQCRKPGFICQTALKNKQQCALFHQNCQKMKWSQIQNIIYQNPNTKIPQFSHLQEEMELFFSNLIKKVKDEHVKFKIWARTFGYSEQMNNFISLVNDGKYNQISGVYMNQILSQIFMKQEKNFETPFTLKQVQKINRQIESAFQKISELYNFDGKGKAFRTQSIASTTFSSSPILISIDSKVTQEVQYIRSLFYKQNPCKFTLLYRASQYNFSAAEFHRVCDNIPNTLTLVRTEFDKVIGGYTPLAWNSSKKHWAADKSLQSFIFSLDLKERFALNLAQFAVACNSEKGPIFGCCDICIVDKSNIQKSNAEFPISYNNFKYARNAQSSLAFTGSAKGRFCTKQWEVFRIDFE